MLSSQAPPPSSSTTTVRRTADGSARRWRFSRQPDIGAPGGLIRSTYPLELPGGGYATISGTSMSSPHVAGAVALLKEAHPSLPASAFRDVLENSADPAVWSLNPAAGVLDN